MVYVREWVALVRVLVLCEEGKQERTKAGIGPDQLDNTRIGGAQDHERREERGERREREREEKRKAQTGDWSYMYLRTPGWAEHPGEERSRIEEQHRGRHLKPM
jgi:hypothetical protein